MRARRSWYGLIVVGAVVAGCQHGATPTTPTATTPAPASAAAIAAPAPISDIPPAAEGIAAAFIAEPSPVRGGDTTRGTVTIPSPAPAGGTVITFTSSDRDVRPPASITIPAGQTSAMFLIETSEPHADTLVRVTATGGGVTQTLELMLLLNPPGAHADYYTIAAGDTLTVRAPGILDNDVRRPGHDLTAVLHIGPMSGTLTLREDGGFTYRPNASFTGSDRFIYRAMDGVKSSNAQHAWITVGNIGGAGGPSGPSQTYIWTGSPQAFVVPPGVTSITIEAYGAQGAAAVSDLIGTPGAGGLGGLVQATLAVVPGAVLQVNVGGPGQTVGVRSTGGGGGASDVRSGAFTLNDRLVVAGGGGGGGGHPGAKNFGGPGGAGGGLVALAGGPGTFGSQGGAGGTQTAGGAGGGGVNFGTPGALGQGGAGQGNNGGPGGFNGGGNGGANDIFVFGPPSFFPGFQGGGGGGGYYGGGGGGGSAITPAGGGGGGGSSFTTPAATNVVHQQGVQSGNGLVIIRW